MGQVSGQDCRTFRHWSRTGTRINWQTCKHCCNGYNYSRAFEQSSIIEYPPFQAPPVGIPAAEGSSNFFGLAGPAGGLALPPRWVSFSMNNLNKFPVSKNSHLIPSLAYLLPWWEPIQLTQAKTQAGSILSPSLKINSTLYSFCFLLSGWERMPKIQWINSNSSHLLSLRHPWEAFLCKEELLERLNLRKDRHAWIKAPDSQFWSFSETLPCLKIYPLWKLS